MDKFKLKICKFTKKEYLPGYLCEEHNHEFYHYMYISKGSGYINIDKKDYKVNTDELYLIPMGTNHSIWVDDDEKGFNAVEIKFEVMNLNVTERLNRLPYKIEQIESKIKHIINELVQDALSRNLFYEEYINIKFEELLIYLLRQYNDKTSSLKVNEDILIDCSNNQEFSEVIEYIYQNIDKHISISKLAKSMGFSESYFCTAFKEKFSITPGQFINQYRIFKAKELLMNTNYNITEISYKLGFKSIHYFSRFFKRYEGISPFQYMTRVKKNINVQLAKVKNNKTIID